MRKPSTPLSHTSYPRDLDKDAKLCEAAGVDVIFHPEPEEMYTPQFCSYVDMNGLTTELCGKTRPTHFRGVQTVVLKLFHIVTPDRAYFGSFPSGHTCASFAVALVCLRMLPGKWGILPVVLAGMIAFSRLYLGVHYPGDVLAGFLVALLTSTVACRLMRRTFSPQKS